MRRKVSDQAFYSFIWTLYHLKFENKIFKGSLMLADSEAKGENGFTFLTTLLPYCSLPQYPITISFSAKIRML